MKSHELRAPGGERAPGDLTNRTVILTMHDGMLVDADAVDGTQLESVIAQLFENVRAEYLHVHYARPGCYAARVERA